MLLNAAFLLFCSAAQVLADLEPFYNDKPFDEGKHGPYPVQTYRSTKIVSPRLNILLHDRECDSSLYTMMTPRGIRVAEPMAMILDANGHLVWGKGGYGQVYNLKVQQYKGNDYLTFWAGDDTVGGHGAGFYHMLDNTYKEVYRIKAANSLGGDLHEFRITEKGTALISVYEVEKSDLSDVGGKPGGKIWDCLIQEIDIETGELIFEWHAADYFRAADSAKKIGANGGDSISGKPFDYYHLNSIDKDDKGNYLVSSRYMCEIAYISGQTGEILWVLGGVQNNFTDLSGGAATNFGYQHDARWQDNFTTITVFDNAIAEHQQPTSNFTRGLRIKIDQEAMTAELVAEYVNPNHIRTISQGSLQVMDNGNVLMGYGNSGAFTEYAANGTALCDTHMGPQSWFGSGDIQSYRIFKYDWHGYPTTKPDSKLVYGDTVWYYVSWNGATEVVEWVLQGASNPMLDDKDWVFLNSTEKKGFEAKFELYDSCPRYVRSLAIDAQGAVLGVSEIFDIEQEKIWDLPPLQLEDNDTVLLKFMMGFAALTGFVVGIRELITTRRGRKFQVLNWRPRWITYSMV